MSKGHELTDSFDSWLALKAKLAPPRSLLRARGLTLVFGLHALTQSSSLCFGEAAVSVCRHGGLFVCQTLASKQLQGNRGSVLMTSETVLLGHAYKTPSLA